jgi:hypothetical protein
MKLTGNIRLTVKTGTVDLGEDFRKKRQLSDSYPLS